MLDGHPKPVAANAVDPTPSKAPAQAPATRTPDPTPSDDANLAAAARIGRKLITAALWSGDRCTWLGWTPPTPASNNQAEYVTGDGSLYGGSAGIAYFLAYLHAHAPTAPLRKTLSGALRQTEVLGSRLAETGQFGSYSGAAGAAHVLLEAGRLLQEPRWTKSGLALLDRCKTFPFQVEMSDVLVGSAGIIPILIAAGIAHNRDDMIAAAVQQAEQLAASAERSPNGLSWPCGFPCQHNLLGYGHGVSGYAVALAEAAAAANREDLLKTAFEALKTEQHFFDPTMRNWPDFRLTLPGQEASKLSYMTAWCHGAVGIAAARHRILTLWPQAEGMKADLDHAVATTEHFLTQVMTQPVQDFGLCHGLFGAADVLLLVQPDPDAEARSALAMQAGTLGRDIILSRGKSWPLGPMIPGETPGLMLGLAGIGHFYLRLFNPSAVPSPLLIHPASRPKKT